MSSRMNSRSDDSESDVINSTTNLFKNRSEPTGYFQTDVHVTSKNKNQGLLSGSSSSGKCFNERTIDGLTSGDGKLVVSVNTVGSHRKNEISVKSSFTTKKKVDNSTQSDRNITGEEECFLKERKKWVRPPLVGQAANVDNSGIDVFNTSSDSDTDKCKVLCSNESGKQGSSYFPVNDNERSKCLSNDRNECEASQFTSIQSELNESQRGPSPASASSLTSARPLEWDSGADVGYQNACASDGYKLSTLEKLALSQGSVSIFTRSDPEGTTGTVNSVPIKISIMGPPTAESTPRNTLNKEKNKKNCPLFPEVIIKNMVQFSDKGSSPEYSRERVDVIGVEATRGNLKKLSTSLEELGHCAVEIDQPATFPRSHSHANVHTEGNAKPQKRIDSAKSHSSSSASTVVNKQNIPKKSIFVNQCRSEVNSDSNVENKSADKGNDALVNSQPKQALGSDGFNTLDSGQMTPDARVNSFEYLPGHVYENVVAYKKSSTSSSLEEAHQKGWDGSSHPSLQDDVERGANLLAEFVRTSKAHNPDLKKELVQRVVQKIINTNYPEDDEIIQEVDQIDFANRGQISGESSVEKSQNSHTTHKIDKCVGTGLSTSLSGCTETSDWNSASEYSRKSSNYRKETKFKSGHHRGGLKRNGSGDNSDYARVSDFPISEAQKKTTSLKKDGAPTEDESRMVEFLKKERKNQLYWIKSEIDHLTNLKMLLEKHETLKKNLAVLKKSRVELEKPLRTCSEKVEARKNRDQIIKSLSHPMYSRGTERSGASESSVRQSSQSQDSDWNSHHYETEDDVKKHSGQENIVPKVRRMPVKCDSEKKQPTAYSLNFSTQSEPHVRFGGRTRDDQLMLSVGEIRTAIDQIVEKHRHPTPHMIMPHPTLQEWLENKRPDYVARAEARRQILTEIVALRQARQASKAQILAGAPHLPPPPLAVKRVFSQKNLRKQTEKKYRQLSEVKNKKAEYKRKEEYRTNRLMAEIFTRKLQKKTLKGEVNLSNSVTVII